MNVPINSIDYLRFLKLAKLIKERGSDSSTISIYVASDSQYAAIEMRGHGLPADQLREFFEYQPTFEELEAAKRLLERAADEQ